MRKKSLYFTVILSQWALLLQQTLGTLSLFKSTFLKETLNQKSNKEKVYSPIWLDFKQARIAIPDYFFLSILRVRKKTSSLEQIIATSGTEVLFGACQKPLKIMRAKRKLKWKWVFIILLISANCIYKCILMSEAGNMKHLNCEGQIMQEDKAFTHAL